MEKLARLDLNEREWGAMFAFMMLGIAYFNGERGSILRAYASVSDKSFGLDEVNPLIDKMEILGQQAFNVTFSNDL